MEAFSDAVFAIAITLLVLEIHVPSHQLTAEQQGLARTLLGLWPNYLSFITSFTSILVIWVKHHWMFTLIKKTDHSFLYWNGLLLFFVTFLPFPTALLADYLLHPDGKIAANIYTGTILAISISFRALWRHATKDKRLLEAYADNLDTVETARISRLDRYGPHLYLVAFTMSFLSEGMSIAMCLVLGWFFAVKDWLAKS